MRRQETTTRQRLFQFTPLREGRLVSRHFDMIWCKFQFTPLREGRRAALIGVAGSNLFQFTPLREGRPAGADGSFQHSLFQVTPLREGRQPPDRKAPSTSTNFNSRPSARGDPPHMPMAGKETYFNSRPSARGDALLYALHTVIKRFQFTPLREGRRFSSVLNALGHLYFNSRPSARGDWQHPRRPSSTPYFNSRPSARGDVLQPPCALVVDISIHAPPRGATALVRFA